MAFHQTQTSREILTNEEAIILFYKLKNCMQFEADFIQALYEVATPSDLELIELLIANTDHIRSNEKTPEESKIANYIKSSINQMRLRKKLIIALLLICFCFLGVKAQTSSIKKQTKIAKESLIETTSIVSSMIAARIPISGLNEQLDKTNEQLISLEVTLKYVKTKEDFEASIPRIAAICNSVITIDRILIILSPNQRTEINFHLKKFRKAIDEIVLIYLKHDNKRIDFIRFENKTLTPYYMGLANYHNDWKKNYEF